MDKMLGSDALVVLSGGQDSTTCLFWAKKHFTRVHALSFDYGQRHKIELEGARKIAQMAQVASYEVLPIDTFKAIGGTALTDAGVAVGSNPISNLPATFVPGRNLIFLTYAAAYAWKAHIYNLVTGTNQTDYSGYPDCREETLKALEQAITLGMEKPFKIYYPLMHITKAETVKLGMEVGAMEALAYSHTCYNGQQPPCGTCDACILRIKGFAEAGIADPLLLRFVEEKQGK